jgi:hypothetical protein
MQASQPDRPMVAAIGASMHPDGDIGGFDKR